MTFLFITFLLIFGLGAFILFVGEVAVHKLDNKRWEDIYADHCEEMDALKIRAGRLSDQLRAAEVINKEGFELIMTLVRGDLTVGDLLDDINNVDVTATVAP